MAAARSDPYGSVCRPIPFVRGLKLVVTAAADKVVADRVASVA